MRQKTVAGHLEEKGGKYYAVISYKNNNGKRERKWIGTGLTVKGNKRKAENKLNEIRKNFTIPNQINGFSSDMPFSEFYEKYLNYMNEKLAPTTMMNKWSIYKNHIKPYFSKKRLTLSTIQRKDLQIYFDTLCNKITIGSLKHLRGNIHASFDFAVKFDLIDANPCSFITLKSRKKSRDRKYYNIEELNTLLHLIQDNYIETPVVLSANLGLRRGEALGLKWQSINFDKKVIKIENAIVAYYNESNNFILETNYPLKTQSSYRTLPMNPTLEKYLISLKKTQTENMKICGDSYNKDYLDFVCVDNLGQLITPRVLSNRFYHFIKDNNLPELSFHGLRHTYASILLSNNIDLKIIQALLGHSSLATTANVYTHTYYSDLINANNILGKIFNTEIECKENAWYN